MLQPMSGRLASDPELKKVATKNGEKVVINNTVYVKTSDKEDVPNVPVQITAWEENARLIADKYKKGDFIQFVGKPISIIRRPKGYEKDIVNIGYEVKKIDENGLLLTATNKMLNDYIKSGEIDKIQPANAINPIDNDIEDKEKKISPSSIAAEGTKHRQQKSIKRNAPPKPKEKESKETDLTL